MFLLAYMTNKLDTLTDSTFNLQHKIMQFFRVALLNGLQFDLMHKMQRGKSTAEEEKKQAFTGYLKNYEQEKSTTTTKKTVY